MKYSGFHNKLFIEGLLFIVMIPLLFLNINNRHDWGDDFAQYILQAMWMAGSIAEIPVTDVSGYSPGKKGILFSILLIPSAFFSSHTILLGKIFVSLSLLFSGLMFFRFLNERFNSATAFIATLFLVYNIHMLRLKDQVLPDLLFSGIILLVFVMMNTKKQNMILIAFALAGLTTGLKSSGYALVLALLISLYLQTPELLRGMKLKLISVMVLPCLIILFLESVLSDEKSGAGWYVTVTVANFQLQTVVNNLEIYKNALGLFFEQELPLWLNQIIRYFIFIGFAGGWVIHFRRKSGPLIWFVLIYVLFLLIYPYNQDPVRFIIPLIPFVLFYVLSFYHEIAKVIPGVKLGLVPLIITLVLSGSQFLTAKNEIKRNYTYEPWTDESREMILFVKNKISDEKIISFHKPWALAYFTQKHCVPVTAAYKSDWLIFNTELVNPGGFHPVALSGIAFKNDNYVVMQSK